MQDQYTPLPAGVLPCPTEVLNHPNLTDGAKVAYLTMLSLQNRDGIYEGGCESLARSMGANARSVQRYMQSLERHRFVIVIRNGQGQTNTVHLAHVNGVRFPLPNLAKKTKRAVSGVENELRWVVWERDNFTCQTCGARRDLTIDHIQPRSKGGSSEADNLRTLCLSCNSRKGAR